MITFLQTYGQVIGFGFVTGSLILLLIFMLVAKPKVKSCCKMGEMNDKELSIFKVVQQEGDTPQHRNAEQEPFKV